MIKTVQKTIDGSLVSVTELPYTRAQELGVRLLRDLGPVGSDFLFHMEGAQDKISKSIRDLTSSLSHQNLIEIARELFYNATLKGPKSKDAIPFMKNEHDDNFDAVMAQDDVRKPLFFKALVFALEVNYRDFLLGPALKLALDKLKSHVKVNLPEDLGGPAPKSSPAGEPGGSS